jgi:hypothetical protein
VQEERPRDSISQEWSFLLPRNVVFSTVLCQVQVRICDACIARCVVKAVIRETPWKVSTTAWLGALVFGSWVNSRANGLYVGRYGLYGLYGLTHIHAGRECKPSEISGKWGNMRGCVSPSGEIEEAFSLTAEFSC